MAYLTRRPGTHALRLALLPPSIILTLWCTVGYHIEDPAYGWFNWSRGLMACATISKLIHFAWLPSGMLKVGEEQPGGVPLRAGDKIPPKGLRRFLPAWLYDALEVSVTTRGLGWQFAQGTHVPRARRPSGRNAYMAHTASMVLRNYFFVDFCDSVVSLLPGITMDGGTIFLPSLPPITRYLLSTAIQFAVGIFIISCIEMYYDLASLVGVGCFRQSPTLWPPVHDEPWRMSSLHEFWSKRWHQLLRSTFLVLGGYPGRWVAGDIGMLFGTFIASGLFHEIGFHLGGAPLDPKVLVFFVAQAFGILAEKMYRAATGKRVGGWGGTLWGAIFVLGIGQICTDSWVARGAAGRPVVPPEMSISKHFIMPALHNWASRL
ncbi:hypothetical protein BC628DRAFT_1352498 [Trametes gibbosa]|nr:hypothetical protein BC628DRAFT_1352498 [Trametes gibbosa]